MYLMIQKRNKTVEKGRPVEVWDDYFKCWCEVKSLYGKELYSALEAKLENVVNFETRFCGKLEALNTCLLYTSPSPRDRTRSRMPSSA